MGHTAPAFRFQRIGGERIFSLARRIGQAGEIGLAGHWMKRMLHTLFIYKAKARPGWWLIPE